MLSDYDIKDQQTVCIRLRLKGGGLKPRSCVKKLMTSQNGATGNRNTRNPWSRSIAIRRRSQRQNLKRPRAKPVDCENPEDQSCPLCNEELTETNNQDWESVVSCCKCERGFHVGCSGIQEGWSGHWNLECKHTGLDCRSAKVRPQTKASVKKTNKELSAALEKLGCWWRTKWL